MAKKANFPSSVPSFISNNVISFANNERLRGGVLIKVCYTKQIRSMCLELQFSRPRWRWVSAATIASDRYV